MALSSWLWHRFACFHALCQKQEPRRSLVLLCSLKPCGLPQIPTRHREPPIVSPCPSASAVVCPVVQELPGRESATTTGKVGLTTQSMPHLDDPRGSLRIRAWEIRDMPRRQTPGCGVVCESVLPSRGVVGPQHSQLRSLPSSEGAVSPLGSIADVALHWGGQWTPRPRTYRGAAGITKLRCQEAWPPQPNLPALLASQNSH